MVIPSNTFNGCGYLQVEAASSVFQTEIQLEVAVTGYHSCPTWSNSIQVEGADVSVARQWVEQEFNSRATPRRHRRRRSGHSGSWRLLEVKLLHCIESNRGPGTLPRCESRQGCDKLQVIRQQTIRGR